jgi:hypothetical protein
VIPARSAAVALLALLPARAVELNIQFGALERMLGEQVFTHEGRRYVHGDKTTTCSFAYLERPRVEADRGRLRIRARFTGRSALNVFGQCVGVGDAFDLSITALPAYRDGSIGLRDVTVNADGRTGFYIRRVCSAMAASLARDFRYPVAAEARRLLEAPAGAPGYPRELRNFSVDAIRVNPDSLVLELEFELTVR